MLMRKASQREISSVSSYGISLLNRGVKQIIYQPDRLWLIIT
jgi:hypothetical protein